ncbi:MAG: hypothetical protein ACI4A3_05895 [Lachnospiraceae bacterium]
MKIDSSSISMDSERFYTNTTKATQAEKMQQIGTGTTTYSSTSFLFTYMEYSGSGNSSGQNGQYDNFSRSQESFGGQTALRSDLYTNSLNHSVTIADAQSSISKLHEELIRRLEELMEQIKNQLLGMGSRSSNSITGMSTNASDGSSIVDLTTSSQPGSLWTRQSYQSVSITETENTTFQSTGTVVTADGRSIDFNISMEMSRSFTESAETLSSNTQYILTDPLVIQLEDAPETIDDQKWFFDIDGDGKEEEISQLAKGNAFLAMDKDGNGKIDNGNELFGAKTGNGFQELSAYDEDGNGWIDENDSAYSKLKIWVKDASGNDKLMDLKQADIGAIYLGASNTEFTHKTIDTNETQAVVRQTGFYLHESTGSAGIMQQIDFAAK